MNVHEEDARRLGIADAQSLGRCSDLSGLDAVPATEGDLVAPHRHYVRGSREEWIVLTEDDEPRDLRGSGLVNVKRDARTH